LDAIPTIGFSDPILSYLSALQFFFKSVSMLKEGYEKVTCLASLYALAIELITLLFSDKTGSIQDRQISGMVGVGCRI
jgi:hypothetical protein